MSFVCFNCTEQVASNSSIISFIISLATITISFFAYRIASKNFKTLSNSHALQAQMNLINLERELSSSRFEFKKINNKINDLSSKANDSNYQLVQEIQNDYNLVFEKYMSNADKIAALIISGFLELHFVSRSWSSEYQKIFKEVQEVYSDNKIRNICIETIDNVNKIVNKWENQQK